MSTAPVASLLIDYAGMRISHPSGSRQRWGCVRKNKSSPSSYPLARRAPDTTRYPTPPRQTEIYGYWFMGEDVARCSEEELALRRRTGIGFVFQNFNLIDDLNVAQNVEVSLLYRGVPARERRLRVEAALVTVGLVHRAKHMPKQLSGGQQQRVAVARALVAEPKVILADEPQGNLDTANGDAVMQMLSGTTKTGTSIVMVTHSEAHAARANRVVHMLDGRFVDAEELAQC